MAQPTSEQPIKRTRMSGEERRAFILAHAKHVFANHSYAEASTGELARASGVTEPMLYKHFGSKKGLFLAVLREFGTLFRQRFQACVNQRAEHDLLDALAHVIVDYRTIISNDLDMQRVFMQSLAESSDPAIAQSLRAHNEKTQQFIYQLLERARTANLLDCNLDLEAATWGYMSFIYGMQYRCMLSPMESPNLDRLAEVNQRWLRALQEGII